MQPLYTLPNDIVVLAEYAPSEHSPYWRVKVRKHPLFRKTTVTKAVAVMTAHLGRRLEKNEEVHHKDRDKENDAIDNLKVMTKQQHLGIHGKERADGMKRTHGRFRPSSPIPSPEQKQLIDDMGGPTKVAAIIEKRTGYRLFPQAISNWRVRGIPFRYRAPLALEAGERDIGVPIDFLGEQTPAPKPKDEEVPFL